MNPRRFAPWAQRLLPILLVGAVLTLVYLVLILLLDLWPGSFSWTEKITEAISGHFYLAVERTFQIGCNKKYTIVLSRDSTSKPFPTLSMTNFPNKKALRALDHRDLRETIFGVKEQLPL